MDIFARELVTSVKAYVSRELSAAQAFIGVVTGLSSNRVQIRRVSEVTGGSELYARIAHVPVQVGDEVLIDVVSGVPTIIGRLKKAAYATPTITPLSPLGTSGAATLEANSSDYSGLIILTGGSASFSAGGQATFNFAQTLPDTSYAVLLTPGSNAAADMNFNATSRTVNGWNINFRSAPTSGTAYHFYYFIRPFQS